MSNQLGNLVIQLTQKEVEVYNKIAELKNEIMARELQVARSIKGQRIAFDKAIKEAMAEDPDWESLVKELESLKVTKSILSHTRKHIDNFTVMLQNEDDDEVREDLMQQLIKVLEGTLSLLSQ